MAKQGEAIAHSELVGGGVTTKHSHPGGGGAGTIILIDVNETETTGGSTEQTKTYSLPANSYSRVLVEFDWELAGATNAAWEWTLAVEIPQASVIHDSNIRADATGTGDIHKQAGNYKGSAVQQATATLRVRMTPVTAGGATARILSMRVFGVV